MSQDIVLDSRADSEKNIAWFLYLAHAATLLFSLGALSFIPLIINYVKRGDTEGSYLYTHHSWMIRSFWWYIGWCLLGALLFVTFIGIPLAWLIWIGAWCWKAYRLIKGFNGLNNHQAMPA